MFLLLLVVFCWYSGWFVGLMFKRQQNESAYGKSVTVSERVLCLYCYWFVLGWYSGWFVGLIFKRQQNESTYVKSVRVTDRILFFYCYWLFCIDIAVGFLVWCSKDNRMNRLTVKVWQLLRGFCVSTVIGCVG